MSKLLPDYTFVPKSIFKSIKESENLLLTESEASILSVHWEVFKKFLFQTISSIRIEIASGDWKWDINVALEACDLLGKWIEWVDGIWEQLTKYKEELETKKAEEILKKEKKNK